MKLVEGGNIWPDATTGFDPSKIAKPLEQATEEVLKEIGLDVHVVGSGYKARYDANGNVVPTNDLDVMVDLPTTMTYFKTQDAKDTRKALANFIKSKGLETFQSGVTVHARVPVGDKFYQVDIKVVNNAAKVAMFHRHDIPQGSPYKGVNKQLMITTLASSKGLLWSADEGLYKRDAAGKKAELISDDMDEIAKVLLGPQASAKDLGSVESIMASIPNEAMKNDILAKAAASSSWMKATPKLKEGSREWFRYVLDSLK